MRSCSRATVFVFALALAVGLAMALPEARQQPTFRAGVDVVTVDVSVSRGGEHIGGLTAANFEVLDNGVRQKIDRVRTEQVPLEAYLVFDMSGSIEGPNLERLKQAAGAFVDGLTPQDQVALVTFSDKVDVRQPLTGNFDAFREALSRISAGGQTALYDATVETLRLRHRNDNRAVVLVLTDQGDNASNATQKDVMQAAEHSDVIAYGVLADQGEASAGPGIGMGVGRAGFRPPQIQFQIGFLRSLAETTGGRVFRTNVRLRLDEAFALVLEDARSRYVITYSPDRPTPGWHKLHVRLIDAKGDVAARRGYYVGGN